MSVKPWCRSLWQDIKISFQVPADIFHKDEVKWRPSLSQVIYVIYSDVTWTNRFCYIIGVGSTLYAKYQLYSTKTHKINIMFVRFEVLRMRSAMIVLLSMKLFSLVGNAGTLQLDFVILGDLHYCYYHHHHHHHHHWISHSAGKHLPILGCVINRIRLDGLIYNLKSFLQLNMFQELQIFSFVCKYSNAG